MTGMVARCISSVLAFVLAMVFVGVVGCRRTEKGNGCGIAGKNVETSMDREPQTNKIEILQFKPNLGYPCEGESHFVVEFFAQVFQVSTNFHSYDFARRAENNKMEDLRILFFDKEGNQVLAIPCVSEGQDMAWPMDGTRIVQLYGSFIFTFERCELLKDRAAKLTLSDGHGNLLDEQSGFIEYDMTEDDISTLILNPLSKRGQNQSETN